MEKRSQKPEFAATILPSSVPHRDMEQAAGVILKYLPQVPSVPVMARGIRRLPEGNPCAVIGRENRRVLLAPAPERENELLELYEKYDQEDPDCLAATPKTAPFIFRMLCRPKKDRTPKLDMDHLSYSPLLPGDHITQSDDNSSMYHEALRDVLNKADTMETRWL
jgi:hypothetical protein